MVHFPNYYFLLGLTLLKVKVLCIVVAKVKVFLQCFLDLGSVKMVRSNDLLSDSELTEKHFETTQEMIRRGMVGVEAWLTGEGLVTHGSPAAREAMIAVYEDNINNMQNILRKSSLEAAQQEATTERTTNNQVAETLRISKPARMVRPLSLMNEKQLIAYSIDLINRQHLAAGNQMKNRRKIDWGLESQKPEGHPDEMVNWTDIVQSPGRMTNAEFQLIAIEDHEKFPRAPHKPTKTDYFKALIHNILIRSNVPDPESYFDKEKFSSRIQKNLGRRNKTAVHLRPAPPPRQVIASSTPNPDRNVSDVIVTPPPRSERTFLSPIQTPPRPTFAPTTDLGPPEVPSFSSEVSGSNGGDGGGGVLRRSTRATRGIHKRKSLGGNASYAVCHFCKKSFYVIDTIWAKCDHGHAIHWNCYRKNPTCGL